MSIQTTLSTAFQRILDRGGTPIRVQYFTQIYDDVFDDAFSLSQSGTDLWTSGVIFPLINKPGHADSILLEQGKLINGDSKIYLHGSLILTGSEYTVKITIGSPTNRDNTYTLILPGTSNYYISNTPIYKTAYIRKVGGTGSLLNEQ